GSYSPTCKAGKRYMPSAFVRTCVSVFVDADRAVTGALRTPAPDESCTTPEMLPRFACAWRLTTANATLTKSKARHLLRFNDMSAILYMSRFRRNVKRRSCILATLPQRVRMRTYLLPCTIYTQMRVSYSGPSRTYLDLSCLSSNKFFSKE